MSVFRDTLSWLSGTRIVTTAVRTLDRIPDRSRTAFRVLTWHRILPITESAGRYPGVISTTPETFATQAQLIRDRYSAVSIDDVVAALNGEHQLPRRAVLLTFDDAYNDFLTNAFPVLRRMGLPVTLFVPTAFPDNPALSFWWNQLYSSAVSTTRRDRVLIGSERLPLGTPQQRHQTGRRLVQRVRLLPHSEAMSEVDRICDALCGEPISNDVLSWNDLRRLAQNGVSLAPHTRSHPLLNQLPLEEAREEIAGSISDLKREIGTFAPVFAYPAGGFAEGTMQALSELGIKAAFTTQRGINDVRSTNRMSLNRINVGRRANEAVIRLKMHRLGAGLLSTLLRPASALR
ncbi:MAG: polysaccharide deacetylase family protein [Planctomycetaceae bacterium]